MDLWEEEKSHMGRLPFQASCCLGIFGLFQLRSTLIYYSVLHTEYSALKSTEGSKLFRKSIFWSLEFVGLGPTTLDVIFPVQTTRILSLAPRLARQSCYDPVRLLDRTSAHRLEGKGGERTHHDVRYTS
ncbi:hypothetical protein ACN38_g1868 [Penicillium nordicum]|uniref:Uncharacterized protein n=1 Tax=Penicillium nordicum TaxID=229535 RepID=A0A0N0RZS3_9EURO|nr:hypothetical protein ACN38_g1868 [Penicillium nordicum]